MHKSTFVQQQHERRCSSNAALKYQLSLSTSSCICVLHPQRHSSITYIFKTAEQFFSVGQWWNFFVFLPFTCSPVLSLSIWAKLHIPQLSCCFWNFFVLCGHLLPWHCHTDFLQLMLYQTHIFYMHYRKLCAHTHTHTQATNTNNTPELSHEETTNIPLLLLYGIPSLLLIGQSREGE